MSAEFQTCPIVQETIMRVAKDPFTENVTHGGLHPSSISKIVENLFWTNEKRFKSIKLEITKEMDDHHISVKVLERNE